MPLLVAWRCGLNVYLTRFNLGGNGDKCDCGMDTKDDVIHFIADAKSTRCSDSLGADGNDENIIEIARDIALASSLRRFCTPAISW